MRRRDGGKSHKAQVGVGSALGNLGGRKDGTLGIRGEVPSAPASVKTLRPLYGAQDRAALTDASAPGGALS